MSSSGTVLLLSFRPLRALGLHLRSFFPALQQWICPQGNPRGGRLRLPGCWAAPTHREAIVGTRRRSPMLHMPYVRQRYGNRDGARLRQAAPSRGQPILRYMGRQTRLLLTTGAEHCGQAHLYLEKGDSNGSPSSVACLNSSHLVIAVLVALRRTAAHDGHAAEVLRGLAPWCREGRCLHLHNTVRPVFLTVVCLLQRYGCAVIP